MNPSGAKTFKAALASLHFGEEPPLVGDRGSGTFFLSGCNLRCPFCQNWQISRGLIGKELTIDEGAEICLKLQEAGAANVNFVTGSHSIPQLIEVIKRARELGLTLPILWNSSAFEKIELLEQLAPHVDIWLPDLKTTEARWAQEIYGREIYAERARKAVKFMIAQSPLVYTEGGMLTKGTIIRHLIIPGYPEITEELIEWFAQKGKDRALLSLLSQYTPVHIPGETHPIPERYVSEEEYERVIAMLEKYAIDDGFIQELETGSDWLPDFREAEPFSADLSRVIWKSPSP
ncbi:MAG: radical SAM protein [Spirochaetales bacterium]|nr:radical SAM protein [Spirochaetales bacterium]